MAAASSTETIRAGRRTVELTRPDKILFPGDGITKRDLARYYARAAPAILPHVAGRPVTMERYPDGIDAGRIYQKQVSGYFPEWIARAVVAKHGGTVEHVLAHDAPTLVYLANQASITPHVWLSDIAHPEHPSEIVFDLDPSECTWSVVVGVAHVVRDVLGRAGLVPFLKLSGSRGLHVHAPLDRSASYEEAHAFALDVADMIARDDPRNVTTETRKAKREACLFLDTGRNRYAQTIVAPYAVRARPGAPVAVPLHWEELDDETLRPDGVSMDAALARIASGVDPWRDMRRRRRSLRRAARALAAA